MTDKTEVSDKPKTSDKSKLDKLLEGENITLNCLIPGEEARDIFEVTISTIKFLLSGLKSETVA